MLSWILWLGTTSEITLGSNKSLGTKDLFQFQPEVRTTSGQMTRPHGIDQEDCSRFKQRQPSSPSGAGSDCASWQTSGSSGTWGRSLKTGNEEYCWTLKCRIYPSCSYASWWKASWFHHGGSSWSETHLLRRNPTENWQRTHLVMSCVVLGLGHGAPGLETDLKPGYVERLKWCFVTQLSP